MLTWVRHVAQSSVGDHQSLWEIVDMRSVGSVRRAEVTPYYLDDMTLAYIVASIYLRSDWWIGLVLVGLVCGGGVHHRW